MTEDDVVFLFDVDNTLLDNDCIALDLKRHLEYQVGPARGDHYWEIFEQLRAELGYADYLGALQRYRVEDPHHPHLLAISHFLLNYPFAERVYPKAIDVIHYASRCGKSVILSDGDVIFQPLKVERSGLSEAVDRNVLIYVHKEQELEDVERRYPAAHYVMVDDKLRILDALKSFWGRRVTTVFPRQGHYALDPQIVAQYPAPDVTVERIGDLLTIELAALSR